MVDILSEKWNQLEAYVFGAYQVIKGLSSLGSSREFVG